tara:strand:- start:106 stop:453 length:348 start_codon:yes stop_codon:yes gene_type:complete
MKILIISFGILAMAKLTLTVVLGVTSLAWSGNLLESMLQILFPMLLYTSLSVVALVGLERRRTWGFWVSALDLIILSVMFVQSVSGMLALFPIAYAFYLLFIEYGKVVSPTTGNV